MNRKMADISGMFRDALQALPAKPSFSVYSGYENPDTNLVYGVNWEMLKGKWTVRPAVTGVRRRISNGHAKQSETPAIC